jgi:hypothetical protein
MAYFKYITEKRKDSTELIQIMESVSMDLQKTITTDLKPGILLGLIQSGKTRAFIGVIAKCFDLGYDVAVVFTKNSVALVEQTIKRLKSEFSKPIESNKLYVWDVIRLQSTTQLTGYILNNKIILVVKKEKKNLDKLHELFESSDLINKKVLMIDDEADQASVSFVADKQKEDGMDLGKISESISNLRTKLLGQNSYLQVTATPYSLYLQPEDSTLNSEYYSPLRPTFTHILKPHSQYVGGKVYFEDALDPEHPASHIHIQVSESEMEFLNAKAKTKKTYDERITKNMMQTSKIEKLRFSILSFLAAGAYRQLIEQNDDPWAKPYHCSFVLHTSTQKKIHTMQINLTHELLDNLVRLEMADLSVHLRDAYENLLFSIKASNLPIIEFDQIAETVFEALRLKHIGIIEVNSDNQVEELLGDDGQLRLDNPFNIFVGGQSLDRGITIEHLIGFFYGRDPKTFQMDTVLQHSRMYGNRSKEDLAVTRFYTLARIYEAMRNMHWFDQDLRDNIEKDVKSATAHFIAKKGNEIIPAGPQKLKASGLLSFKEYSRLLPIGFQTSPHSTIKHTIAKVDELIKPYMNLKGEFIVDKELAITILELINSTFIYEPRFDNVGLKWDIDVVKKALELALNKHETDKVIIYHREDREASRLKENGNSFGDAPEDGRTDRVTCKKLAENGPVLLLLKQKGREADGWRDSPFYWPVLVMPKNMPNYVYCID